MKKLKVKLRLKEDVDLSKYGFIWKLYESSTGICWTNGLITYYSKTNEIEYDKMTQEVFDSLLYLTSLGVFLFMDK